MTINDYNVNPTPTIRNMICRSRIILSVTSIFPNLKKLYTDVILQLLVVVVEIFCVTFTLIQINFYCIT